jgi:hypothetical protein
MILPLLGLVLGALLGAAGARWHGGQRLDMLQWAAVWGMMGGVLGVLAMVILGRLLG